MEIKENAEQYIPLFCYTATSSYALGLTKKERQEVVQNLRRLFDYYYDLTIEKTGKYHSEWEEYSKTFVTHKGGAMSHRSNVSNFTEGNTFVCIGSPDGYYFNDKEQGLEFGEITYVIYGMYNFLKNNTDYNNLINSDIRAASDLYEDIINNPSNRRVYLRMRLKKSDIAYLSDTINDKNCASEDAVNKQLSFIFDILPARDPIHCTAAGCSAMLNAEFQFAKPLGNCKYELCEGIEEIKDVIFEREMASAFIKLIASYK